MDIITLVLAVAGVGSAAGAIFSARVAIASRKAAEAALVLQQEQWDAERSALICFESSRVEVRDELFSAANTYIGVAVTNRGRSSATDLRIFFRMHPEPRSSFNTLPLKMPELRPNERITATLSVDERSYPLMTEARLTLLKAASLVIEYQDFKTRRVEFFLSKRDDSISEFHLVGATLNEEPHPGHQSPQYILPEDYHLTITSW